MRIEGSCNYPKDDERSYAVWMCDASVRSGETCCLSMRVEGHVGGHISVPARIQISWDLVGQSVGPGLVDPIRPVCCR